MGVGLHKFEVREQATAYSSAVINIVQSGEPIFSFCHMEQQHRMGFLA